MTCTTVSFSMMRKREHKVLMRVRKAEAALSRAQDRLREAKELMEEGYDHAAYEVILVALKEGE